MKPAMLTKPAVGPAPASVRPADIRLATAADAEACGRIMHDAFQGIAAAHGFPKDFPSREAGIELAATLIADPKIFGVVAEIDGVIVGSNFVTEGDEVRGVGPITVDPSRQEKGVGRRLMQALIERASATASVRLVQDAFNTRSVSLYASLGFEVKEPLLLLRGIPDDTAPQDAIVRQMTDDDLSACTSLCVAAHGVARTHELRHALRHLTPMVLERAGRVTGYMTAPGIWLANHGVAETEQDMRALLVGTAFVRQEPLSLLLPSRQAALLRWSLTAGMRVIKPMTLMVRGTYQDPSSPWFPSVFY